MINRSIVKEFNKDELTEVSIFNLDSKNLEACVIIKTVVDENKIPFHAFYGEDWNNILTIESAGKYDYFRVILSTDKSINMQNTAIEIILVIQRYSHSDTLMNFEFTGIDDEHLKILFNKMNLEFTNEIKNKCIENLHNFRGKINGSKLGLI